MIKVHHLNNSRSHRILWLLEELELPYEIVHYQRDPQTMRAPASLVAVHPLGKSPVVTDGDVTVAESGAIIEYLVDTYGDGRLKPAAGTAERRAYTYWLHFAEGSTMPMLLLKLVFKRMAAGVPAVIRPIIRKVAAKVQALVTDPALAAHMRFVADTLDKTPWFAGAAFSAADIQMSFPVEGYVGRVGLDASHKSIQDFLDRIRARPAYQRAIEKGGAFSLPG